MNSGWRTLTIILATVVLSTTLLGADSCNEIAYGQAAVGQADQGMIKQQPSTYAEMGSLWNDVSATTSDAQHTLTGLQGDLAALKAKKPMSDADRQQMSDRINKANTIISQWGTKKQDWMSQLSTIRSQVDSSGGSSDDAIKAKGDLESLRLLINQGDGVVSNLKSTVDDINKYK